MYTTVLPQLHALDWGNKRGAWQRHGQCGCAQRPLPNTSYGMRL